MHENVKEEYIDFIKNEILSNFNLNKKPVYLSTLGESFSKKFGSARHTLLMPLRDFIYNNVRGVEIISHPYVKQKVVIVPEGEVDLAQRFIGFPLSEEICPNEGGVKEGKKVDINRVQNAILIAFQKKVDPGMSVYVKISRPVQFSVLEKNPDDKLFIEIRKDLLRPCYPQKKAHQLSGEEADRVRDSISEWVLENSINIEDIYFDGRGGRRSSLVPERRQGSKNNIENALTRLFEAQSEDVRRSVVIPLDIAEFLSRVK